MRDVLEALQVGEAGGQQWVMVLSLVPLPGPDGQCLDLQPVPTAGRGGTAFLSALGTLEEEGKTSLPGSFCLRDCP